MDYKLQKIGSILWVISLVLLFFSTNVEVLPGDWTGVLAIPQAWNCYLLLIAVLIIDFILVKKKEPTITQWFRKKFSKKVDTIITIVVVALFIYSSPIVGLYLLQGTIHGHLNGDW